jgi:thiol:disulfide interchange protein
MPRETVPAVATTAVAAAPAATDAGTLLAKLAAAFLGGIILNLMPCVLPVISLKIFSFLEQAGESRARVLALNIWYSLGLFAVFMLLAVLAASLRIAWGEQFTLPWFKVGLTGLVFVMALSFLGTWEIPIPGFIGSGKAGQLQVKEGAVGAFFKGVFTTILATPCSGPLLGGVFGYLLTQPPFVTYLLFGAIGLGMASPYLIIGANPELMRFLPKPGAWMDTLKQVMGFLLLFTVVYLFSTMSAAYFIPTLTLLVGLWFAAWWIGRTPLTAELGEKLKAWAGGIAVAAVVGLLAFTVLMHQPGIAWQPFSPEALARARAEGKTVMVDFTADWCPTCKANLKFAIDRPEVRRLIEKHRVVPMIADWTDYSPVIKQALNELGYNSIPVLAIWPPQGAQAAPIVLSDLLRESQVIEALKAAGPSMVEHAPGPVALRP